MGLRRAAPSLTHACEAGTGDWFPAAVAAPVHAAGVQPERHNCAPIDARQRLAPASLRAVSTPPDIALRPARPGDLAALVALEQTAFAYDRMSRRQYQRHLGSDRAILLVAESAGELLGSALLFLRRHSDLARLYSLATAAASRGRGVGRALLSAIEAQAITRGIRRIRLEVRRDNTAAVALYEGHGYRRVAALDAYYDDGADAWRYEKTLPDPAQP